MPKGNGHQENFATPNWRALIEVIVHILERKDPYTRGHSQRVQSTAKQLGRALAKTYPDIWDDYLHECLAVASLLHDVGKIVVETSTLLNQRPELTPEQHHELFDHPYEGSVIVKQIFPVEEVVLGILHHHERWDGQGYPLGLKANRIPPIARVISICDAYDAMITWRTYSAPVPKELAVQRILDQAGQQFDPDYAKIFTEEVAPNI